MAINNHHLGDVLCGGRRGDLVALVMTPLDQFRASVALGVLEKNDTAEWVRIFRRGFGPEEADAIEDIIEIVRRMADEAATPASEPSTDAHSRDNRPVPSVAAPYREV